MEADGRKVIVKVVSSPIVRVSKDGTVQVTYPEPGEVKVERLSDLRNVHVHDISKLVKPETAIPISGRLEPGEADLWVIGILAEGETVKIDLLWYPGDSYMYIGLCNLRTGTCVGYVRTGGAATVTITAWSTDPYGVLICNLGPYTIYYQGHIVA